MLVNMRMICDIDLEPPLESVGRWHHDTLLEQNLLHIVEPYSR